MNLNLSKRLLTYTTAATAAGVGALALAQPAEARIVYTRVNKPLNYGLTTLDLNNDGIPDFGFCIDDFGSSATTTCVLAHRRGGKTLLGKRSPSPFEQVLNVLPPASESKRNQIWANAAGAYALAAGVKVGGNLAFTPGSRGMAACFQATSSTCGGNWSTAPHRYLGLKFVISGQVHYGWARLNVTWNLSGESATLTGYAYETIANKAIITGNIVGPSKQKNVSQKVPKADGVSAILTTNRPPASLGLLAMGAHGMAAWRKKDEDEQP